MKAFVKDGELHVITDEDWPIFAPEERHMEAIYDKKTTDVMREAFRKEQE